MIAGNSERENRRRASRTVCDPHPGHPSGSKVLYPDRLDRLTIRPIVGFRSAKAALLSRSESRLWRVLLLPFRVFGEADNANVLPLYATPRQDGEHRKTGRASNENDIDNCKLKNMILCQLFMSLLRKLGAGCVFRTRNCELRVFSLREMGAVR